MVQLVQRQTFSDELDSLSAGHPVKVVVESTLRVGGRIHHAPISYEPAHPMILSKKHPVSTLIIRYFHEILGHAGRDHLLSCVRQHFCIIQARSLVRQVVRKCISCRRRNEAPLNQIMADLPKQRLTPYEPPFSYTGVESLVCSMYGVVVARTRFTDVSSHVSPVAQSI